MAEIVYLNGSLIPRSRARISPFDHGFLYGYGLFETMRACHGSIFLLERHITRLMNSAELIGLGSRLDEDELRKACLDTLKANDLKDARVRLAVSGGEANTFPGADTGVSPTVLVTASHYTPPDGSIYDKGFRVGISSFKRYSRSLLASLKSANYLLNVLAKREAEAGGLDEVLLLNEQGCITEGSISNVFFVDAQSVITPPLQSGILPGITRHVVMGIAVALGIGVSESDVRLEDLAGFDEAFLTNSMMEIMPLVAVKVERDKVVSIGTGKPGELTGRLMVAYRKMVDRETQKD